MRSSTSGRRLGTYIDERCTASGLPPLEYGETFELVRTLLTNEVHLDQEQLHLTEAARVYRDVPDVHVPALLPFCTPRITAMEASTANRSR